MNVNVVKFLLLLLSAVTVTAKLSKVIVTELGSVQGVEQQTVRDKLTYAAYYGIPFAAPPVGELRFKAPLPASKWTGILNATEEGNVCHATSPGGNHISEDCLNLNIYTPVLDPENNTELRAVMVYIYGGTFLSGSNNDILYGPELLIEKDVIVVSMNYRLGALGFLSLQNEEVPGNAGLKDQVLALKFVKNNIVKFGGDVNRITLFGESAGAASASHLHLAKATTNGLFNRVILQSGTAISKFAMTTPYEPIDHAFRIGNRVGCVTNDTDELLDCLRNASAADLAQLSQDIVNIEELLHLNYFLFAPVIEPNIEGALITKDPLEILEAGEYNDVNVMLGLDSQEALLIYPELRESDPYAILQAALCSDLKKYIPSDLIKNLPEEIAEQIAQNMSKFYFDNELVGPSRRQDFLTLLTDQIFMTSIQRYAKTLVSKGKSNVYNYHFVYEGPFNLMKLGLNEMDLSGACHGDEVGYLFNDILLNVLYPLYGRNSTPHRTIDRMTEMWTNFAKTGNPTPQTDDIVLTILWKPLTEEEHNYLEIGEKLHLKQGLDSERARFWNDQYEMGKNIRPLPE